MSFRKYGILFLSLLLAVLVLMGGITVLIDPFFHYHAPLPFLQYELYYQRYQNDGIVKHFDYDAIITGNSLSENFRSSELDSLFGVHSVKVPFSGASPKELARNNRAAIEANPDLRLIVMNLDYGNFVQDKDYMSYDADDYPEFLYNSSPFDDVKYIFNKNILSASLNVLKYTLSGQKTTSFDDYSFWYRRDNAIYSEASIRASFEPGWNSGEHFHLDGDKLEILRDNITQNVLSLADQYPQTQFYVFYPPYSIYFWAKMYNIGELEFQLEADRAVAELLLEHENIHLFSFVDEFSLVTDLNRYKDYKHYDGDVNSWMLACMASGEHEITRENCGEYFERIHSFYTQYDYSPLL